MRRALALAGLLLLPACGTSTLDAGHNIPDAGHNTSPDACGVQDAGGPGCTPIGLLDNLVGYWHLDDGMGSQTAFDSSGRGNNGVLHDLDPSAAWVAGRSVGALAIGHAGWVQVAPSPSIDAITDHVTVSGWINLEGSINVSDRFATALSRQIGTSKDQLYHISLDLDARPSLFVTTVDGYVLLQGPSVPMGTWTHLAGVYDGTMARFFVNGVEQASASLTGAFVQDAAPVILGGNGNDGSGTPTELVPGRIDELMLYARALSAAEIAKLAAGALFPGGSRDAGTDGSRDAGTD